MDSNMFPPTLWNFAFGQSGGRQNPAERRNRSSGAVRLLQAASKRIASTQQQSAPPASPEWHPYLERRRPRRRHRIRTNTAKKPPMGHAVIRSAYRRHADGRKHARPSMRLLAANGFVESSHAPPKNFQRVRREHDSSYPNLGIWKSGAAGRGQPAGCWWSHLIRPPPRDDCINQRVDPFGTPI